MLAFIYHVSFFLAARPGGGGGFTDFYNQYFNIPGFELWKFINLAIFIAIITYFVRKPLSNAFKARREHIRAELIRAEAEKQAALERLSEAEAKVAQLEAERAAILESAKQEAAAEKARLAEDAKVEIERLKRQREADLDRLEKQTFASLRRFSAEESIRLAEEKLRAQMDQDRDVRLVRESIQQIGGLN